MGEHPRADRASRIIDILGFTPDPYRTPEEMLSRANLLTELHRHSILKEVPAEIATIFKCLEQVRSAAFICAIQHVNVHIMPRSRADRFVVQHKLFSRVCSSCDASRTDQTTIKLSSVNLRTKLA